MHIAATIEQGNETGGHVIILTKEETQDMIAWLETFCDEHKRMRKAKSFLRKLEKNALCY